MAVSNLRIIYTHLFVLGTFFRLFARKYFKLCHLNNCESLAVLISALHATFVR